jgi:hypothetical protein
MTSYRILALFVGLLCSVPALAQRAATAGATGVTITSRTIVTSPVVTSPAATTNWHQMTAGIRAGQALWRNFWHDDHAGAVEHNQFGRNVQANAFGRDGFGRGVNAGTTNILTGTSQRVDILTGRPID